MKKNIKRERRRQYLREKIIVEMQKEIDNEKYTFILEFKKGTYIKQVISSDIQMQNLNGLTLLKHMDFLEW